MNRVVQLIPRNRAPLPAGWWRERIQALENARLTCRVNERWFVEADRRLVCYAGWFWGHEIPAWVGEGWINFVRGAQAMLGPIAEPDAVDWQDLWMLYVENGMAHQHDYRQRLRMVMTADDAVNAERAIRWI